MRNLELPKERIKLFTKIVLVCVLLSSVIAVFGYIYQMNQRYEQLTVSDKSRSASIKQLVDSNLSLVFSDLEILHTVSNISDYFVAEDPAEFERLQSQLLNFAKQKEIYDQVRVLDANGKEKIRLQRDQDDVKLINEEELQDKSDRYYFTETKNLSPGELFISAFDLNVENDELEIPYKPQVRFGMPIFTVDREFLGAIILNVNGNIWIDLIKSFYKSNNGYAQLINEDGYYLMTADEDLQWGFMFDDERLDNKVQNLDPELWESIKNNLDGQIIIDGTLHNYSRIFSTKNREKFWYFVSTVPKTYFDGYAVLVLRSLLALKIIFIIMISYMAWRWSGAQTKKERAEDNLGSLNEILKVINKILRHDLKNKFTAIKYLLEMHAQDANPEHIDYVQKATMSGLSLVSKMGELENLTEVDPSLKEIALNQFVRSVIGEYNLPIELVGDGIICGDAALESVFANLINNAISHGETEKMRIEIVKDDQDTLVKVIDYGKGISDEAVDSIFKEGWTMGDKHNSGLGLYIVKKTVERYGGIITLEKNLPKGATFILRFPEVNC